MRLPHWAERSWEFVKEIHREYSEDNASLVAAAMSFYIFLSLIPLMLLAVAIFGYVLGSPDRAKDVVLGYLRQVLPGVAKVKSGSIVGIVDQIVRGRGTATGVGIVVLLWSGTNLMANLEHAINVAWDVTRMRGVIRRRLVAVVLLLLGGVLFGISLAVTAAVHHVRTVGIRSLGIRPMDWPWFWDVAGYFVPLAFTVGAFTLVYKLLPNTRVRLTTALVGGVFTGLLWELAKLGFGVYVTRFGAYSAVYGSLGGVILLLIWIHYSAVVTILGAEVASTWQRQRSGDK